MEFSNLARLSNILAKSFAENLLRLLVSYENISASEAASRLDLHIKTAQDFLEELVALDIAAKQEVFERKRPYFRYRLKNNKLSLNYDLNDLYDTSAEAQWLRQAIREKKNSGANFSTAGGREYLSSVSVYSGEGRQRRERKISLTERQGRFLYHLPFPTAKGASITHIMDSAGLDKNCVAEILDIVSLLLDWGIVEKNGTE